MKLRLFASFFLFFFFIDSLRFDIPHETIIIKNNSRVFPKLEHKRMLRSVFYSISFENNSLLFFAEIFKATECVHQMFSEFDFQFPALFMYEKTDINAKLVLYHHDIASHDS